MRGWRVTLTLCVVGVLSAGGESGTVQKRQNSAPAQHERRSANVNIDRWLNLVADYTRGAGYTGYGGYGVFGAPTGGGAGGGGWFPPPFPVQLPIQGDNGARSSVPLLVVPVPVPVPAPRADPVQCQPNAPADTRQSGAPPRAVTVVAENNGLGPVTISTSTYAQPASPLMPSHPYYPGSAPPPLPPVPQQDTMYNTEPLTSPPAPPLPPPRTSTRRPVSEERFARNSFKFPPIEDSRLLVEQFQAQQPLDPTLPPVVIDPVEVVSTDDYTLEELQATRASTNPEVTQSADSELAPRARRRVKCRRMTPEERAEAEALAQTPPPLPRFERPMFVRARLTVPRADYTETYSIWWDAASGASRVDFHGGATSSYRLMKRDGQMQSILVREDRTGEANVRRCMVSQPRRVTLAERALPALPDLQAFSFGGYVKRGAVRVERWRHTQSGHAGELGGAHGEALTFRHELLVLRAPDNYTTTPLRYSVHVDSSLLGADCDLYVHYFDEVQTRNHDPAMFSLNIADACEHVELTDKMENVEPLREFTMLRRDPRYDAEIARYKKLYERRYVDNLEEAVRKNVLMQSVRHSTSGNRQGASFELTTNFLSDRLRVEQQVLFGVAPTLATDPGEPFPHSRAELNAMRRRLPRNFDWRERGGVTHVRNQKTCSSCWAFATVGAVEGALFVQTGRLVPLSEQTLVDCAGPYGGHGCRPTWPSAAYEYVKDKGLPALDEYTQYQGEELTCRADSVPTVTRISGHVNVTRNNIVALKMAIRKYGPTLVIIDANPASFISYKKNYYHDARCKLNSSNHAVLAVGWKVHRGETYFILKNSWTPQWGEEGYINVRASTNTCGVLRLPSHPRLRAADVLNVPAAAPTAAAPLS